MRGSEGAQIMSLARWIHLAVLLLAFYCISIGGEIEYFRHVEIDNLYTIDTRYKIDKSLSDTVNCFKVEYDNKKRIKEITYMKDGKPSDQDESRWAKLFINRDKNSEARRYEGISGALCFADTNLALMVYSLKDDGALSLLTNYDKQGKVTEDSTGVAQYIFDVDDSDRVIKTIRLNATEDTITDKLGFCETRYLYDTHGNNSEEANYGKDGKLLNWLSGAAIVRGKFDSLGNPIEARSFDENGIPVVEKTVNAAIVRLRYDNNGYINSMRLYGADNQLMPIDDNPYPMLEADYSDRGNPIEYRYFGSDEKLRMLIRKNEHSDFVEQCYFGPDGKLRIDRVKGYARNIVNRDKNGNIIEESYQGPDSQLVMPPEIGYARQEIVYNTNGYPIEARYFGSDNKLKEQGGTGCAILQWDHDGEDRITEVRCFGNDGEPKEDAETGIAIVRVKYDVMGNEIEKSTFGVDGRLKNAIGKEYSISRFKYDKEGRLIEYSAYGPNGKPVIMKNAGYAMARTKYDLHGNRIEDSYYGTDGNLILARGLGFARSQCKYDENGNLIEDSNFGAQNEPIVWSKGGYFKSKRKYDSQERLIEASFYDVDGALMERKGSDVAVIRFKYDDDRNIIEKIMFDKNMNVSSKTKSFEDFDH
jgi:hypothetical protein